MPHILELQGTSSCSWFSIGHREEPGWGGEEAHWVACPFCFSLFQWALCSRAAPTLSLGLRSIRPCLSPVTCRRSWSVFDHRVTNASFCTRLWYLYKLQNMNLKWSLCCIIIGSYWLNGKFNNLNLRFGNNYTHKSYLWFFGTLRTVIPFDYIFENQQNQLIFINIVAEII